jgi:hypothetical protein
MVMPEAGRGNNVKQNKILKQTFKKIYNAEKNIPTIKEKEKK